MENQVKYIIVGQGVAGSCLALKLLQEKKSFCIIDQQSDTASKVAVGVYNPVVLKRFSIIWHAAEQMLWMKKYFQEFERILGERFIHEMLTYRIFNDEAEVKTWRKKAMREDLSPFLNVEILEKAADPLIQSQFGLGIVKQTGRIDLKRCLEKFAAYLLTNDRLYNETFDFDELKIETEGVQYKGIKAQHLVFCEGYGIKQNPYFNYLPIIGVKGEVLKIETQKPIPNGIWKGKNFLLPIEGNLSYTASTYDRDDLTVEPTEKGKKEMLVLLEEIYQGKYEIKAHTAGIRPTVVDRRPIVGKHPQYPNLHLLNGMGTRGTLLAPQMSEYLFDQIEKNISIEKEANVRRFDHLYAARF
ncbi:MAG TPA: FAD-binding oxidoreductase [Moheibacter sp.]|nr:FAD-binding oxidoreductase [Moheibacter sp.]